MECKDCKFWQGNKYSEYGDCYRVIGQLCPDLLCCYQTNEHGDITRFFDVPFDPHEVKYWMHNEEFMRLYKELGKMQGNPNVVCVTETRDDIVYDQKNGERLGRLKLYYFKTHKDRVCREEDDE